LPALLKSKGLFSFANKLGELPEGAMLEATNVVIDREGIVESRRGMNLYGTSMPNDNDRAKQLLVYKNKILRHYDSTIQFDTDGTFFDFAGSYDSAVAGLRIKYQESNGNLYFTTSEGIKKISAVTSSEFTSNAGYITNAGGAKALDLSLRINYNTSGFFPAESKVAYRVVWGRNDANSNLILGFPSERSVIANISETLSATVNLTFSIPEEITSVDYFYQVYRTAVRSVGSLTLDDIDPGDEMNLVYEANVTLVDIANQEISITDITPDDFRIGGTPLYTNPSSGEGILQGNDKPPFCKDIATFQDQTFYANTRIRHRYEFNILGLSAFVASTSKFIVSKGNDVRLYTFVGETEVFTIPCNDFAGTASGSYILMYTANNERSYFFWFDKTGSDVEPVAADTEGKIGVKVTINGLTTNEEVAQALVTTINSTNDFDSSRVTNTVTVTLVNNGKVTDASYGLTSPGWGAITITNQGDGEEFDTVDGGNVLLSDLASPAQAVDETARSLVRVINADNNNLINAYYMSGLDDLPGKILLESQTLIDEPFYVGLSDESLQTAFNPTIPYGVTATVAVGNPAVVTKNAHGLVTGNIINIYSSSTTPQLIGSGPVTIIDVNNFSINVNVTVAGNINYFTGEAISSAETNPNRMYYSKIFQPEAVPLINFLNVGSKDNEIKRIVALRDSLLAFKDDGIYRVTGTNNNYSVTLMDSSAKILAPDSIAILNNNIYMISTQGVVLVSDTGVEIVSRDIENEFIKISLLPNFSNLTVATSSDLDRAYYLFTPKLSTNTSATQCFRYNIFTRTWTKWDVTATCAVFNDALYVGATDTNYIEKERRDFAISDYCDRELHLSVIQNRVNGSESFISDTSEIVYGDVLQQIQYLTIFQFNSLLSKLDNDPFIIDNDYTTLEAIPGDDLSNNLILLANKLDLDNGLVDTDYASSISGSVTFEGLQSDFNIIVDKLNLDNGAKYSNYRNSTGTTTYHSIIMDINRQQNVITTDTSLPLISGDVQVLKAIQCTVEWAPVHFGAPDTFKQVSEGTVIFEDNTFSYAEVAYRSDLSRHFESIGFEGNGSGEFGTFNFGSIPFGGGGNEVPERTFIPRNKQRCRYISCRFKHVIAKEGFAILGISFVARQYSSRAYR
jgi:hypothetical protein